MKTLFVALLASLIPSYGFGSEDRPAPPTVVHIKNRLPAPWYNGEIIAQADYRGERNTARLRSLTIIVGKDAIKVPQRIRDFFPAVNLGTFELLYGPPPDRGSNDRRYVLLMFRFGMAPEWGIFNSPTTFHIGWIVVKNGRIDHLEKIEEVSDKVTEYTEYDPKTLKETGKTSTTRVQ